MGWGGKGKGKWGMDAWTMMAMLMGKGKGKGKGKKRGLATFAPEKKVWVGNIPEGTTYQELQEHFGSAGTAKFATVFTGKGQGTTEVMVDHQLSSGNVFVQVLTGQMKEAEEKQVKKDKKCTPNIRALAVSAFLFTTITIAQVFAALAANSRALMMDCISMGVDAFTYMGNIVVECRKKKPGKHVLSQLIIVACSLSLLCYFTYDGLKESWATVQECRAPPATGPGIAPPGGEEEEGEEVNGWITLVFALGGVAFDLMCMMEFYKSNQRQESIKAVNMFSAFLHVGADFLRSSSTTVMSLIILLSSKDSTCVDAYTSVIIGASIIAGAFLGFWKWLKLLLGCVFGWERTETTVG